MKEPNQQIAVSAETGRTHRKEEFETKLRLMC